LDLAIMDVATGYFGRIHIATDSLVSMPFVRDLTSLASEHATRAAVVPALPSVIQTDTEAQFLPRSNDDFWSFGPLDNILDLEDWSTFSRTSPNGVPSYVGPML
jgi:hypothetical protein